MNKILAYTLAGGILLLVADTAPKVAIGTTTLILLGVALTHADQLQQVATFISTNTKS